MLIDERIGYVIDENKHEFPIFLGAIIVFIGFWIFRGCHIERKGLLVRRYLSRNSTGKNPFSRNTYTEIKSFIHFNNNKIAKDNQNDKALKIMGIMGIINSNQMEYVS